MNPSGAAANAKRLEAEKIAGGKTFKVGQAVSVRIYDETPPELAKVLHVEVGGWYGNIVRVQFADGSSRRVVASRVTRRKA